MLLAVMILPQAAYSQAKVKRSPDWPTEMFNTSFSTWISRMGWFSFSAALLSACKTGKG
jgi:hypothetical protein